MMISDNYAEYELNSHFVTVVVVVVVVVVAFNFHVDAEKKVHQTT